jgi:GTP-binding protein
VGDFVAINQELELYNPDLAKKEQVVVVNKLDIPEVRAAYPSLRKELRRLAGHTRVVGISAATGSGERVSVHAWSCNHLCCCREGVKELMSRVRKVVAALPRQSASELFTEEEERVSFDDQPDDSFEVFTDERYPGQFRVVGAKIEKVVLMTNWDYYESVQRFQRILEAEGISAALKEVTMPFLSFITLLITLSLTD